MGRIRRTSHPYWKLDLLGFLCLHLTAHRAWIPDPNAAKDLDAPIFPDAPTLIREHWWRCLCNRTSSTRLDSLFSWSGLWVSPTSVRRDELIRHLGLLLWLRALCGRRVLCRLGWHYRLPVEKTTTPILLGEHECLFSTYRRTCLFCGSSRTAHPPELLSYLEDNPDD